MSDAAEKHNFTLEYLDCTLGKYPGIEFFRDRGDVFLEEFEPLLLEADLVHVNVHRRDVFVAAGQTLVLNTKKRQKAVKALVLRFVHRVVGQTGEHITLCLPPDHWLLSSMVSTRWSHIFSEKAGNQ